jgi:galactokinase
MTRRLFVPGRIELFGKHVDYGGGLSMTCAIEVGITAEVEPIEVAAIDLEDHRTGRRARVPLRRDARPGGAHGGTYIAAVARRLARDFGPLHKGVRVLSESSLPRSAGLSSSSAFVTLLTLAVAEANALMERPEWQRYLGDRLALAEYCGAVETGGAFGPWAAERGVGTRGGAQDHVAILCNTEGQVGVYGYLPARAAGSAAFPEAWALLVATSGVRATKTGAAQADYNRAADLVHGLLARWNAAQRRDDHSLAAALASGAGARAELARLAKATSEAPLLAARLAQFEREVTQVVPGALEAFRRADAAALRRWAVESQQGAETALRNQVPETMFLARAALAAGAHAASAFGAGFGGSVWAVCDASEADVVRARWRAEYARSFAGRVGKSEWLRVHPSAGVRWLS